VDGSGAVTKQDLTLYSLKKNSSSVTLDMKTGKEYKTIMCKEF
jgi:hypothetical protein